MAMPEMVDLVGKLPTNPVGFQGTRDLDQITHAILHWNGPPVLLSERKQLEVDANYHAYTRDWNGDAPGKVHARTITYHIGIGQSGAIYNLNPLTVWTWHVTQGNPVAVGVICLLGKGQTPSTEMMVSVRRVFEWLITLERAKITRSRVYAHGECGGAYYGGPAWGNSTECPGPDLLAWARSFRKNLPPPAPVPQPAPPPPGGSYSYYPETGYSVGGDIRRYFLSEGGVATFGYPESQEFKMVLEDGNEWTCQLFERALLHWRHETAPAVHRARIGSMFRPTLERQGIIPAKE